MIWWYFSAGLIEAGPPQQISPQGIEKEDCNSGL